MMKLILISIFIGWLSTATVSLQTQQFFPGSLSGEWRINLKMKLKLFSGILLYSTDYERNYLKLLTGRSIGGQNYITFVYNNRKQSIKLKPICGCDPCHGRLMTLDIHTSKIGVAFKCNNNGSVVIPKYTIKNRVNSAVPISLQQIMNVPNIIFTSVAFNGSGCLDSFYYNFKRVYFLHKNKLFADNCKDPCVKGLCNKGECIRLRRNVAQCNCRYTALNGLYCNDSLTHYTLNSDKHYEFINGIKNGFIKFSWEKSEKDPQCLLEFIHRYGHVTFSYDNQFLLRNSEYISNIQYTSTNFISVNITDGLALISINNKRTKTLVLSGKVSINVGFSDKRQQCETFHGKYDFKLYPLKLQMKGRVRSTLGDVTDSALVLKVKVKTILIASLSVIFLVILCSTLVIILCLRKNKGKTIPKAVDNVYYDSGCDNEQRKQLNSIDSQLYDLDYSLLSEENNKGTEDRAPPLPTRKDFV